MTKYIHVPQINESDYSCGHETTLKIIEGKEQTLAYAYLTDYLKWMQKEVLQFMHYTLDSFNKYMVTNALAAFLIDANTGKAEVSHVLIRRWKIQRRCWHRLFLFQKTSQSDAGVRRFLHRADGDLPIKLVILQHALKHKRDQRR